MKTAFLATRYGLLGFALGLVLPLGIGYAAAASDGFKPGGRSSAGTAFAIMMPFTAIGGLVAGIALGASRGSTESGAPNRPDQSKQPEHLQLLEAKLLDQFDSARRELSDKELDEARTKYLADTIGKYRTHLKTWLLAIAVCLTLCFVTPTLSILAIAFAIKLVRDITRTRFRLSAAIVRWRESIDVNSLELPRSLGNLKLTLPE